MLRRLILALWLALPLFLVTTTTGCSGDEPVTPKATGTVPTNVPGPLPPPSIGGQPAKGKPNVGSQ